MTLKIGDLVLIRGDSGDFIHGGYITKREGRSSEVKYQFNGREEMGKFGNYDLKKVKFTKPYLS